MRIKKSLNKFGSFIKEGSQVIGSSIKKSYKDIKAEQPTFQTPDVKSLYYESKLKMQKPYIKKRKKKKYYLKKKINVLGF